MRGPLLGTALPMGARPRLRISLHETHDVEADLAWARPLFRYLASRPGREAVVVTITCLDGTRKQVLFRCQVDAGFLAQVSTLLKKRATSGHRQARANSKQSGQQLPPRAAA